MLHKFCLTVLTASLLLSQALAQDSGDRIFPKEYWSYYQSPEQAGFIPSRLKKVQKFYHKRDFAGLLIVKNGAVAVDWGDNRRKFLVHSIRKSMLSALFGVHSKNIKLRADLKALGVDDNGVLTDQERSATLQDILSARSGVYLPAAAEGGDMVSNKPKRGSHVPGSHWVYNNWDFNVAGSIYTKLTGEEIPIAFMQHIAEPLQMQDFRAFDGYTVRSNSEHQAVQFRMSSRDLARLGLLYAREGHWRGQQVIPQDWIKESTQALSETDMGSKLPPHYGYMWWVENDGSYSARGVGGQILAVYPDRDMVVVLRANTYLEHSVSDRNIKKILEGIVSASEGQLAAEPSLAIRPESQGSYSALPSRFQNKSSTIALDSGQVVTLNSDDQNMFVNLGTGELEIRHLSDNQFTIIDRQEPLEIILNSDGEITDLKTPRLFYLRAAHVAQQGDLDKALYWVKEIISLSPESAMAYTNMAKIYIAKGDMQNANKMLSEALNFEPNHKQAKGLKKMLTIEQWKVPFTLAIGTVLLLIVFFVVRKRSR